MNSALFHTATAYAALGEADRALTCLGAACDRSDVWASFLAVDPRLDALRADRRMSTLCRRMDLPATAGRARPPKGKRLAQIRKRLEL
jgi:hypothetical protein